MIPFLLALTEAPATASPPSPWLLPSCLLLAAFCALGAGICAGGEMGVYSVNRVRLSLRARSGDRAASLLHDELRHPSRLLGTLLICYNVLSYLCTVGFTTAMHSQGLNELLIVLVNTIIITPCLFIVVDAVPMEVFRLEPDRMTYRLAPALRVLRIALTYTLILPAVQGLARALSALLKGGDEAAVESERERIAILLKEGAAHGVISETQVGLLDRALALRSATVGDEMVPWAAAIRIDESTPRARLLDLIAAHPFSRFPVVSSRGTAVLGVIETIDLCLNPDAPLKSLITPIARITADMGVRDALLKLSSEGAAMAVVFAPGKDTPRGIVTAKDLIEPLTGELKVF